MAKNISHGYISIKIPFHPHQLTFNRNEFFFLSFCIFVFLPFFFFLNLVRSFSKPQNIEIKFCVMLLSCKRSFVSRNFLGPLLQKPSRNGVSKNQFLNGSRYGAFFFDTRRNFTDKYFDTVWGYHPFANPPK